MKSDIMPGMRKTKAKRMMTIQQFRQRFGEEEQCWKHLTGRRWPRGFVCPRCGGGSRGYMKAKRVHECRVCGYQGSVTAGTIFHKTRVPLRDWFWAIYRMSQGKKGISAVQLSKEIGVGYPTAWLMQHKIRKAMAEGEQGTRLRGLVEVDEGYVGGTEKGGERAGRGAQTKSLVAVAVEHRGAGKAGRPRPGRSALAVMPDGRAGSVQAFVRGRILPDSAVWSDGWSSYRGLTPRGYPHAAIPLGEDTAVVGRFFPWVHVTLSNLKRFLLGTHHKPQAKHLKRYVAEFAYRLNRRWQEANLFEQLAQACLSTTTIIYKDLVAEPELT
jgi:ISXO2-like transposase domain/Transposase zinc-ribbon domain